MLRGALREEFTVTMKTGRALVAAEERAGKVLALAVPMRRMPGEGAANWAINDAQMIGEPRAALVPPRRRVPSVARSASTGGPTA